MQIENEGHFFYPLLPKARMRTITQASLVGGHPSPMGDVTGPSEGDGVMYEARWQHKVRMTTLSLGEFWIDRP